MDLGTEKNQIYDVQNACQPLDGILRNMATLAQQTTLLASPNNGV